jgi:hypothetical protein
MVHHKVADASILSTYTSERRMIADSYSKQSVKNGQKIFTLLKSLNTAGVEDIAEARKNLNEALKNPRQRKKVAQGIEDQREHFDNVSQLDIDQGQADSHYHCPLARASYWLCLWCRPAAYSCLVLPSQVRRRSSAAPCLDSVHELNST